MENTDIHDVSINLCPRCQQKLLSDTKICPNCGYDLDSTKTETILSFGLEESVFVTSDETTELTFSQKETTSIRNSKHIQNLMLYVIGAIGLLMMFLPLFNDNNVWSFIVNMQDNGYKFEVLELLKINKYTTFIRISKTLKEYIALKETVLNPSSVLFFYELLVALVILVIVILSVWLIIQAFFNSYKKKL